MRFYPHHSHYSKRDFNKNYWKFNFRTFYGQFRDLGVRWTLIDQMKICIRFRRRLKMIDFEPDALLLLISFYLSSVYNNIGCGTGVEYPVWYSVWYPVLYPVCYPVWYPVKYRVWCYVWFYCNVTSKFY